VIVPAKPLIAASASLPSQTLLESTSRFGERGAAEPELDLADLQSDSVRRSLLLALEHDTPAGAREQGASHGRLGVEKRRTSVRQRQLTKTIKPTVGVLVHHCCKVLDKQICSTLEKLLFAQTKLSYTNMKLLFAVRAPTRAPGSR
jgi:hypothetical protein